MATGSLIPPAAAETISTNFFDSALKHNLADTMASMSSQQILVIAVSHSHLQRKPPKRIFISEHLDLIQKKTGVYTSKPHFITSRLPLCSGGMRSGWYREWRCCRAHIYTICSVASSGNMSIAWDGFLSPQGLWRHAAAAHHSWAEYRKRLIFEVQARHSVPLQPLEKRRLAGNFMQDLLHSYPSRNTLRPGECTMRQIVACAVCAYKDWIDDFYPCYLWKETPSEDPGSAEHEADDVFGDGSGDDDPGTYKGPQCS